MEYQTDGRLHKLTLNKDEMITLVSLMYDGFEYVSMKMKSGDQVIRAKYEGGEAFLNNFKQLVLRTEIRPDPAQQ